jgi:hypothetical protein
MASARKKQEGKDCYRVSGLFLVMRRRFRKSAGHGNGQLASS